MLEEYREEQYIRVYYWNLPRRAARADVYKAYKDKVDGVVNLIVDLANGQENKGTGYFVVRGKAAALELIGL